jgi:2-polyprenyl-6-methoxyphenol hydroxylase-like FAD-dependent oxidoreductase
LQEWLLAHRIHLHETLKATATSKDLSGIPVELYLSSPVIDVDPSSATITLKDATSVQGDAVIGADGVHSRTRLHVPGAEVAQPFSSGKSAFRFMIERSTALQDPVTRKFAEKPGELIIWYAADRRLVMYPTSDNTLLNFVCIHPEAASKTSDDWDTQATHKMLLDVYQEFAPAAKALIAKADAASLKSWRLLDLPVLPTWSHARLVLIGDAAHPFLPHQGQGAGCAIEDAAALSVVLERGLAAKEIPSRLKLWERIRYERANRLQEYSRIAGRDQTAGFKMDMIEHTNYNLGHDEFDNATQRLREYKWAQTPQIYWRMPIQFGPMPGPRQSHAGVMRNALESTFTTASIKFKTSRTVLQNLFPPGNKNYRFKSPGTVAYASFSQTTLNKMEWLGNSGYNHLGLYIHGVEYTKSNDEVVSGTYMPILFESLTDPIVSGREELGMPKLYSAIDVYRGAESYRINTSWQGSQWGNFRLEGLKAVTDMSNVTGKISGEDDDGILVYRYVPRVGRENKGLAAEEYPVFVPYKEDMPQPVMQRVWQASRATFKIDPLDWDCLPTLHHVISRLAEIPVYEILNAKVVEGVGVPDVGAARRIE